LAGCEAALQLAARGAAVELWEQRLAPAPPDGWTPAHTTGLLAELVCSNSFKSSDPARAQGLLKLELTHLSCHLLRIAHSCSIPGGAALTVDRQRFAETVTAEIQSHPLITLHASQFDNLPALLESGRIGIVAAGPLASGSLWQQLGALLGSGAGYFYDATAPVIEAGSVDMGLVFAQSRYDKGGGDDYINCPLDAPQYAAFRAALLAAELCPLHGGDELKLFEGCLPIEELARRGVDAMRFGPLKPKGLTDPRTGRAPYAAVQLRWEDALKQALSLVGFQTRLKPSAQQHVWRLIPGLTGVRLLRFGRMHRNSYLDAPRVLQPTLQLKAAPRVFIAGQLTGLEGYVSAMATGLWAGLNAARLAADAEPLVAPEGSCLGAMLRFMSNPAQADYAPTAFQYGMLTWLPEGLRKPARDALVHQRAQAAWDEMRQLLDARPPA